MSTLKEIIIERIKRDGPIRFRDFMEMALYYPDLGYYTSRRFPVGRDGDFYTSPHLHPAFGALLAKVLIEMWQKMERPRRFFVIEMGGGAHYLCKDILDYLYHHGKEEGKDLLDSLRYVIVEVNPYVSHKQVELLHRHVERIEQVKDLSAIKRGVEGCVLSNEFLDSFPVHLVEMEDELKEIYVDTDGNNLIDKKQGISTIDLAKYLNEFSIELASGYRTEINLLIKDWLRDVASILRRGFILTIDYGYTSVEYYNEERRSGTLLCYYKHMVSENPYQHIGKQDITAHVNFSSINKWGKEFELNTIGYCPQGLFLIASGIDEVIMELYKDSPDYPFLIQGVKGLILPQGMGETHKVMVQYKGNETPLLKGFSISNYIDSL